MEIGKREVGDSKCNVVGHIGRLSKAIKRLKGSFFSHSASLSVHLYPLQGSQSTLASDQ